MSLQFFVPDIKNNRVVVKDNSIVFQQYTTSIITDVTKGVSTRYNTNKPIEQMDMVEVQDAYEKLYVKHKEQIDAGQSIRDAADEQRMYSILERIDAILKEGTTKPFLVAPKPMEERIRYLTEKQLWQEYNRLMTKYDIIHKPLTLGSEVQQRYVLVCRKLDLDVNNNAGTKLSAAELARVRKQKENAKTT